MHKFPDLKRFPSILSVIEAKNLNRKENYEEFRNYFISKLPTTLLPSSESSPPAPVRKTSLFPTPRLNPRSSLSVKNLIIPLNSEFSDSSEEDNEYNENDDMLEYKRLKESLFGSKKSESNKDDLDSIRRREDPTKRELTNLAKREEELRRRREPGLGGGIRRREEEEEVFKEDSEGRYYYYKRWLWMIFPWACLSSDLKCNYSDQILKCFSSATLYMGVLQEEKYTKRALGIALEAKLKKKMIYGKQEEIDEEMKTLSRMKAEINREDSEPNIKTLSGEGLLPPLDRPIKGGDQRKSEQNVVEDGRRMKLGGLEKGRRGLGFEEGKRGIGFEEGKKGLGFEEENLNRQEEGRLFLTQGLESSLMMKSSTMKVIEKSKLLKSKFSVFRLDWLDGRREEGREEEVGRRKGGKGGSMLPEIKQKINRHNEDALKVMEKEVDEFKKQFNFVKSENSRLEKMLVEIRTKEPTLSNISSPPPSSMPPLLPTFSFRFNLNFKDKTFSSSLIPSSPSLWNERLSLLASKISSSEAAFSSTQVQKDRCEVILVICKRNKQQNQDYIRALNYLLNNFKVCIRRERDAIRGRRGEIEVFRKMSERLVKVMGDKLENNEKLVGQIRKNLTDKARFDESLVMSK